MSARCGASAHAAKDHDSALNKRSIASMAFSLSRGIQPRRAQIRPTLVSTGKSLQHQSKHGRFS